MAQERWYPPVGHPREDTDRIIFDNLYTLLDMISGQNANAAPANNGMSITAVHPAPFSVGSNNFGGLVFKNGILVGVSPATSANNNSTVSAPIVRNSAASTGAVMLSSTGSPTVSTPVPTSPVVATLPPANSSLAVIGETVIYNNQPYLYTAGISGGANYWALDVTAPPTLRDVWANLYLYPAANYPLGTVFYATDRMVSYAVQYPGGVPTWIYFNGIYGAPLANIPTDLGPTSVGFIFHATDYLHNWLWSGSSWGLTTGGIAPGSIYYFASASYVPNSDALWHLCDGSTVAVSQNNGTTANVVLPNTPNYYIVR